MERNENVIVSVEEKIPDVKDLIQMIDEKKFFEFVDKVKKIPSADIAILINSVSEKYQASFYRLLPKEIAAEVFVDMDFCVKENLINIFTDKELSSVLDELYLDDTVDIIEEMPASVVKRIIRTSKKENREIINKLLRYPKDSAGTVMTTEYVRFTKDMTVEAALNHVRKVAIDKETIYTCYVTDSQRRLIGIVTAKDLLINPLKTVLNDIMEKSIIFVGTKDDREEVALKFEKYGFLTLPVVDGEGRLVGIITVDDAISVMKDETEEDFAKMAAITPSETPYLKTSAFSLWKSRVPWLLLLMISATFSSAILSRFESTLPSVLLLFVPMLMDTGGNSGAQASVTVIRAISLGEARMSDLPRVLWKELRVGVACSAILSLIAFLKVFTVDGLLMKNSAVTVTVAASVSLAVALTIITAKLIGAFLPFLAKRIGFDPAVMASPFITTLVDALALVLYFFIGKLLLPI